MVPALLRSAFSHPWRIALCGGALAGLGIGLAIVALAAVPFAAVMLIIGAFSLAIVACWREMRWQARAQELEQRVRDEHSYQLFIENAVEGFFRTTRDGYYLQANLALARVYGYDTPQQLMRELTDIGGRLYVDAARRNEFRSLMRQDGTIQDFISEIRRRDGSKAWISENARSVADETGAFLFYEGTVEDVTARHETEAALRRALQDSEDAARSKAAFLASMSHELKTPLNAIIGFSDLMRQGIFGTLSERYSTYTGHIHDNGKALLAMISDVLDLTRAEGQLLELEEETFALGTVIEEAIAAAGTGKDMPEICADISPDLPWLHGDPRRIRQIVSHVMSNAMKFTTCKGRVSISSRRDETGALVLSIADTGIGMAPDRIPHALEPFRQLDNRVTARRFDGVGVGLPLASALLRLHQGKLHIHSVPGEGTTVDISFPPSRLVDAHKALVA